MATCKYALKSNHSKTVDAKYLGYWSVKWSSDQASAALQAFQNPLLSDFPIIRAAVAQPFVTSLILIAMHGAVYWALAAGIPKMSGQIDAETYSRTIDDLRRGRDDCLSELRLPAGEPLPRAMAEQVGNLLERFYDDVLHDLSDTTAQDPLALVPRISRTASTFATTLAGNLKTDFPADQQLVFAGVVDEAVLKLAGHLQHELEVHAPRQSGGGNVAI